MWPQNVTSQFCRTVTVTNREPAASRGPETPQVPTQPFEAGHASAVL